MTTDNSHRPYRCACGPAFSGTGNATGTGPTRRGVLGALGAWGGFGALGGTGLLGACATGSSTPAAPHRIDVHHHISPPPWVAALKRARLDAPPVNNWTPRRSLDDMDAAGTQLAITSPTQPAIGFLGPKEAADVARASNDYARKLADDNPGRFGVFALLPMPHVDATLAEIAYALDVLKADGVAFMTSYGGKYLGDAAFAPVMDELQRRGATAYTHPNDPACCLNVASGVPPVIIEYGTDTTRTIASLVFSGTSARCPAINFIFSHGGGTLTALSERFTVQAVAMPQLRERGFTGDKVLAELRRFHYDTAQVSNPVAMAALAKLVDTRQILFGTDYPYRTSIEHVKGLAGVFGAADLRLIERDNALRILPAWKG